MSLLSQVANIFFAPVSALLKEQGANPLCIEWVLHYLKGSQQTKQLPQEAISQLHEDLAESVRAHLYGELDYFSCTAQPSQNNGWWWSLWGVVGQYHWKLTEISEGGILVDCWDTWNFNSWNFGDESKEDSFLELPIPESMNRVAITIAKKLGIPINKGVDNKLRVLESDLAKLNHSKSFKTKWQDFIAWEEIEIPSNYKEALIKNWNNPDSKFFLLNEEGYLLPQWRAKEIAIQKYYLEGEIEIDLLNKKSSDYIWKYSQAKVESLALKEFSRRRRQTGIEVIQNFPEYGFLKAVDIF